MDWFLYDNGLRHERLKWNMMISDDSENDEELKTYFHVIWPKYGQIWATDEGTTSSCVLGSPHFDWLHLKHGLPNTTYMTYMAYLMY